jgi:hypothetical protein
VFDLDLDLEHCSNCCDGLKIIPATLEQPTIEKILTRLGLQTRAPPRSPAGGQALQAGWLCPYVTVQPTQNPRPLESAASERFRPVGEGWHQGITRKQPPPPPATHDVAQRYQRSTVVSPLHRPTHTRWVSHSGCHGQAKRAFELPTLAQAHRDRGHGAAAAARATESGVHVSMTTRTATCSCRHCRRVVGPRLHRSAVNH